MKKLLFIFLVGLFASCTNDDDNGNMVLNDYFEDPFFLQYCLDNFDKDNNFVLTAEEISKVRTLDISDMNFTTLKGIEFFTDLRELEASNNQIYILDLTKNKKLKTIVCESNLISKLILGDKPALETLNCSDNQIEVLNLSQSPSIVTLNCGANNIKEINVTNCARLETFSCYSNNLSYLDLSRNSELSYLSCFVNGLTSLDISNNTKLEYLSCQFNEIEEIYVWEGFSEDDIEALVPDNAEFIVVGQQNA